jgi:hypothetical protein
LRRFSRGRTGTFGEGYGWREGVGMSRLAEQPEMVRSLEMIEEVLKGPHRDLWRGLRVAGGGQDEYSCRRLSGEEEELATVQAGIRRRTRRSFHFADKAVQEKHKMQRAQGRRQEAKGMLEELAEEALFWACSDAWNKGGVPWRLLGTASSFDAPADRPGIPSFSATAG